MLKLTAHFQLAPHAGATVESDNYSEFFNAIKVLQNEFRGAPNVAGQTEQRKDKDTAAGETTPAKEEKQKSTRGSTKKAQDGSAAQAADNQKTAPAETANTAANTKAAGTSSKKVTIDDVTKALVGFANRHSAAGLTASREIVKALGVARMGELPESRFQEALDLIAKRDGELSAPANSEKEQTAEDLI
jgi:hypothetical protein